MKIEIETKFNPFDNVYLINKNSLNVEKGKIRVVNVRRSDEYNIHVTYNITVNTVDGIMVGSKDVVCEESNLYRTVEEAMDALVKYAKDTIDRNTRGLR